MDAQDATFDDTCRFRPWKPRSFSLRARQRFARDRRRRLYGALGGKPNDLAMIVVERIIRAEWELHRFDDRLDDGALLNADELRARARMETRLRLDLRSLGRRAAGNPMASAELEAKPAPNGHADSPAETLADYLARKGREKAAAKGGTSP